MADEINAPNHRYYQPRNNIKLNKSDMSKSIIFASGITKIDAWINSQPWGGNPVPALFAASEPGAWYDFSDLTTLFQDSVGTTPVTAPNQTVGLMLDKSQGLVLGTELVSNGGFDSGTGWSLGTGWSISGGVAVATASASGQIVSQVATTLVVGQAYRCSFTIVSCTAGSFAFRFTTTAGTNYSTPGTYSYVFVYNGGTQTLAVRTFGTATGSIDNISVKAIAGNHATQATSGQRPTYGINPITGTRNLLLATDTMATQSRTVTAVAHTLSFTGTGTVTFTGASIAGPLIGTGAGNRVSLTFTPTAASLTMTVTGSVTFAQLELGSTATAYQKVVSQYEVTEAGVASASYISFDGTDDGMVTGTITPGIDKVQVFAGVRKLSDADQKFVVELSATIASNNGSFALTAPNSAAANYNFSSKGTTQTDNVVTTYSAPITSVISGLGDIAGASNLIRVNGSQVGSVLTTQGTGNYLAYIMYIGRRGGTLNPFNGRIYSLIVRFGANLTTGQITSTESWVNGKTGAY